MEDTAYHFSIVLIICLIIIGIQKYQQKKQQEYYEALLENESTQTQATEEMPEPETEEAPDILKSLGIEIPEKTLILQLCRKRTAMCMPGSMCREPMSITRYYSTRRMIPIIWNIIWTAQKGFRAAFTRKA